MMRVGLLMLGLVGPLGAQQSKASAPPATAVESPRNPPALHAAQLLEARRPGVAPRARFSWQQVPHCEEYVLIGRWTDAQSWMVRVQEYRVTVRNAMRWDNDSAAFDVSLAEGSYSWQLVAVFGPDDAGDYANPARVSFDIR